MRPKRSTGRRIWSTSFRIRPSSERTSTPPAKKGDRRRSDWLLARGPEHQDPRCGDRRRSTGATSPDRRTASRPGPSGVFGRRPRARLSGGRQRVRQRPASRDDPPPRRKARDSFRERASTPASRSNALQAPQPSRAVLQPPQALSPGRHPRRQVGRKLRRLPLPRLALREPRVNVNTT